MLGVPEFFHTMIVGLMILIPTCLIYKKAGFHPAYAALVFLPVFGLLIIFIHLAFFPWKNQHHDNKKEF